MDIFTRNGILPEVLTFLLLSNQNIATIWKGNVIIRHTGKWQNTLRQGKEKQVALQSKLSYIDRVNCLSCADVFLSQRQNTIIESS
jgi:hypothetical protein